MLALMLATIVVNIVLFIVDPEGFFPQQDTGRLTGTIQAAQDISFQSMKDKMTASRGHHHERPGRGHGCRIYRGAPGGAPRRTRAGCSSP